MGVRRSVNLPEFYPIPRDKPAANVMSALASRLILHLVQRRLLWVKAQVDFLLFEGKSGFFFYGFFDFNNAFWDDFLLQKIANRFFTGIDFGS